MLDLRIRNTLPAVLATVVVLGLTACAHDPYYHPHPYPAPGPRPHYYYDYYYYPSVSVYFHYQSGYYYYPSGRKWVRSRTLPPYYHLDHRDRRIVRIEHDPPYSRYDVHKKYYKPYPGYRPNPRYDRQEREHNVHKYKEYHKPGKADPRRR